MKTILFILMIFIVQPLFSQDVEKMQYMSDFFEAGFKFNKISHSSSDVLLTVIDRTKISSSDIILRLSYLLSSIEYYFKNEHKSFKDFVEINNIKMYDIGYVNSNNTALTIVFNKEWLLNYYSSTSEDKHKILIDFFYKKYDSFRTTQEKSKDIYK